MEVMLKGGPDICSGDSFVKGEKRIEGDGDKEKIGSQKPSLDDSSLKTSSSNQRDSGTYKKVLTMIMVDKSPSDGNPRPSSSGQKDPTMTEDSLESTKTEMGEVREENKRLKMSLAQIVKDYESLQMQFYNNVQEEQAKKFANKKSITDDTEERDLISLSLGTSSTRKERDGKITKSNEDEEDDQVKEALSLRLQSRLEELDNGRPLKPSLNLSPQNSIEGSKKEESGEAWQQQPTRSPHTVANGDDEVSHPPPAKKARVSVRARCDTPTMNDGCQWRKYGQKIAKGNPCPRAYYRCTVSPGCPVKKQVQRWAEDMSILITTYEGTHNHPLPVSATAMASTTSAAASMLISGSSTSQTHETLFPVGSTTNFYGLNLSFSDNSRSQQFYQSNPSTLLSSPSHPTITLDLTSPPPFRSFSSNLPSTIPRYASTGFSFSSSESTTLPTSWSNAYLNVGTQTYKPTPIVPSLGRPSQEHVYPSCFQKSNSSPPPQLLTEASVAEATKAIASDPNFRSALMAAITSIVTGAQGNQVGRENSGLDLKWGETFPPKTIPRENGCAPTYFK